MRLMIGARAGRWMGLAVLGIMATTARPAAAAAPIFKLVTLSAATQRQAACASAAASCAAPSLTPAAGIVADGAAAVLVVAESSTPPASAMLTTTNEATLIAYDPNYRTYAPQAGSTTLSVSGSQIVEYQPGLYILAIEQAPDILQPGPDGGKPDYTQAVTTTITSDDFAPETLQLKLYPPPILFLHGLWGNAGSLANVSATLGKQSPWQALPSDFLTRFSYLNDAAFDSAAIEATVIKEVNKIGSDLAADQIALGRVDVVAHSMGGLVARHFSANGGYDGPANRTLGVFHQIVTINTPEAGSLLANFLVDNQAVTFSTSAGFIAQQVKAAACPNATTVAACFAAAGENLAPPGQPITAGAVYSLEPNSPNIAGLPSALIPNAIWQASSSTVGQNDNLMFGTNALVFELDSLIAATCPGASYCPVASSTIPTVGSILQSKSNDAIVTLASQTAGCSGSCQSATFPKLAHTRPADAGTLAGFVLSFKNVLQSSSVDGFVACKLANTACPAIPRDVASTDDSDRAYPADPTRVPRQVRLLWTTPRTAIMGTDFSVELKAPFQQVRSVYVRQNDGAGSFEAMQARLAPAPDGNTLVTITPLVMGQVDYILNAVLSDRSFAVRTFALAVAAPTTAPLAFWADETWQGTGPAAPMVLRVGQTSALDPAIVFAQLPDRTVRLRHGVTFRVVQDAASPVIRLRPDGSFTTLREGSAVIEATFSGVVARLAVKVDQSELLMVEPASK